MDNERRYTRSQLFFNSSIDALSQLKSTLVSYSLDSLLPYFLSFHASANIIGHPAVIELKTRQPRLQVVT